MSNVDEFLNKITTGDCLDIMRQLPDQCIKGIVTSPPYNLRNSSGGGMRNGSGGKWEHAKLIKGYDDYDDALPIHEYVEWQRNCLNEMMRVLQPNGVIFYNHKWRVQRGLLQDRADIVKDFPVRQIIIWKRSGGINHNPGYFLPTYEVIYMITKPEFKLSKGGHKYGDIWEVSQERGNDHPAPFPVELPRRCIESIDDGIILDPFIGSGTTAIAAIELNRFWIGIEKSQKFCDHANQRIHDYCTEQINRNNNVITEAEQRIAEAKERNNSVKPVLSLMSARSLNVFDKTPTPDPTPFIHNYSTPTNTA